MSELISKKYGDFDYIIVGAGTSGCLLANRLSADPKNKVLLLEAGGKDDYFWIRVPVGYLFTMNNPRTDWCFSTEASPGLNGRSLNYPRGKVLGGCSSINGMIYMRGQARDYDHWRQLGNSGWGWDEALKYFKRSEGHVLGENEMHGGNGEWRVEGQRLSWEILDAFRDAAAETGIPNTNDFNTGNNEGCGYFEVNQKQGVRWSAANAFLHPIKSRANLTILTESHVNKLQFEGNKVIGVRFWRGNDLFEASVSGEIILASGAFGSPHIMQASGISSGLLSQKIGFQNQISSKP